MKSMRKKIGTALFGLSVACAPGCTTTGMGSGVAGTKTVDQLTPNIDKLLLDAFAARQRSQDLVLQAVDMYGQNKDSTKLNDARKCYTALSADGNALLEGYNITVEDTLFKAKNTPSATQAMQDRATKLIDDEACLRKVVYPDQSGNSVQTYTEILNALVAVYKEIRDVIIAQRNDMLERVKARVKTYQWRSWTDLTAVKSTETLPKSGASP